MAIDPASIRALTFDVFGTILDLGGGHAPRLRAFLTSKASTMTAEDLWARWRNRQRIEQYQDNQFYTGHYGYLDSSRRALVSAPGRQRPRCLPPWLRRARARARA